MVTSTDKRIYKNLKRQVESGKASSSTIRRYKIYENKISGKPSGGGKTTKSVSSISRRSSHHGSSSNKPKTTEDFKKNILANDKHYQFLKDVLSREKKGTYSYESSKYQLEKYKAQLIGGSYKLPSVVQKGNIKERIAKLRLQDKLKKASERNWENLKKKFNFDAKYEQEQKAEFEKRLKSGGAIGVRDTKSGKTRTITPFERNILYSKLKGSSSYSPFSSSTASGVNSKSSLPKKRLEFYIPKTNSVMHTISLEGQRRKKPKVTFVKDSSKLYKEKKDLLTKAKKEVIDHVMGKKYLTQDVDKFVSDIKKKYKLNNNELADVLLPAELKKTSFSDWGKALASTGKMIFTGKLSKSEMKNMNKISSNLIYMAERTPSFMVDAVTMGGRIIGKTAAEIPIYVFGNEKQKDLARQSAKENMEEIKGVVKSFTDPNILIPAVISLGLGGLKTGLKSSVKEEAASLTKKEIKRVVGKETKSVVNSLKKNMRRDIKELSKKDFIGSNGNVLERGLAEKKIVDNIVKEFDSLPKSMKSESNFNKIVSQHVKAFNEIYGKSLTRSLKGKLSKSLNGIKKKLAVVKGVKGKVKTIVGADRITKTKVKSLVKDSFDKEYVLPEKISKKGFFRNSKGIKFPREEGINRLVNLIKKDISFRNGRVTSSELNTIISKYVEVFNKEYDKNILRKSLDYIKTKSKSFKLKVLRKYRLTKNKLSRAFGKYGLKESEINKILGDALNFNKPLKFRNAKPYIAKGKYVGRGYALKELANLIKRDIIKSRKFGHTIYDLSSSELKSIISKRLNEFDKIYNKHLGRIVSKKIEKIKEIPLNLRKGLELKYGELDKFVSKNKLRKENIVDLAKTKYLDITSSRTPRKVELLKKIVDLNKADFSVDKAKISNIKKLLNDLNKEMDKPKTGKFSSVIDESIKKFYENSKSKLGKKYNDYLKSKALIEKYAKINKKIFSKKRTPFKIYAVELPEGIRYVNAKNYRRYLKLSKSIEVTKKGLIKTYSEILKKKRDYMKSSEEVRLNALNRFKNSKIGLESSRNALGYFIKKSKKVGDFDFYINNNKPSIDLDVLIKKNKDSVKKIVDKQKSNSAKLIRKTFESEKVVGDQVLLLEKPKVKSIVKDELKKDVKNKNKLNKEHAKSELKEVKHNRLKSRKPLKPVTGIVTSSVGKSARVLLALAVGKSASARKQSAKSLNEVISANKFRTLTNVVQLPETKTATSQVVVQKPITKVIQDPVIDTVSKTDVQSKTAVSSVLTSVVVPVYATSGVLKKVFDDGKKGYMSGSGGSGFSVGYIKPYKGINLTYKYIADLFSIVYGLKASKSEKYKLLKRGRIFTGFETRKLIK